MKKFVLDTNLFFNMEPGLGMGNKTEDVLKSATKAISNVKKAQKAEFLMPPRIIEEFLSFFEDKEQQFIKDFLDLITIKSPDITSTNFPATVFYKLIEDIRGRSYRGLIVAEEELKEAVKKNMSRPELSKKEFEIEVGGSVKNLRARYRQATRTGFLDSLADLDLIVLAREQDGFLVSSDEGVVLWGRMFAVKEMAPVSLGRWLSQA